VKASPGFGDPMGNHAPEACMAQANSQIGGTIGDRWGGQPVLTRTYRPWMRVSGRAISEGLARDDTHKPMAP
jgi:hypothetical protein